MATLNQPGGSFALRGTDRSVGRMGFGAMQLAGPGVWGAPPDEATAIAVLREAVALGINHIDTADFYGPHVTNELIRKALAPYPEELVIATKVGVERGDDQSWQPKWAAEDVVRQVHANLQSLGVEVLDVVNLRMPGPRPVEAPLAALLELQKQGLVRHIGLSNVNVRQLAAATAMGPIVCVQNEYNLGKRKDDELIGETAAQGVAYVPFYPLGGAPGSALPSSGAAAMQASVLEDAAETLDLTPRQVALAWLLQRSPNVLLIPGTSTVAHLQENVKAALVTLPPAIVSALNGVAAPK